MVSSPFLQSGDVQFQSSVRYEQFYIPEAIFWWWKMAHKEIDLDNWGKETTWNWSEAQCWGYLHHSASISIFMGSTCPSILHFGGFSLYFGEGILVILITPCYIWWLYLVIVPWGHSREVFVSPPSPHHVLCYILFTFYAVCPSLGILVDVPPSISELTHLLDI